MKRVILGAALAGLNLLSLHTQAQTFPYFEVVNKTYNAGDQVFPVATDVLFSNLVLTATYGANSVPVTLYDYTQTAQTTLDTGLYRLASSPVATKDPTLGSLTSVTLTGSIDTPTLDVETTPFGSLTNVTLTGTTFSTTLTSFDPYNAPTLITVQDTNGKFYPIGTLQAQVPEPGTITLLAAFAVGAPALARRRKQAVR